MYELQVEGMNCGHCVSKVTKSVQGIDTQAKVDVDLGARKVRVESTADVKEIATAITEAGFTVTNSSAA